MREREREWLLVEVEEVAEDLRGLLSGGGGNEGAGEGRQNIRNTTGGGQENESNEAQRGQNKSKMTCFMLLASFFFFFTFPKNKIDNEA